MAGYLFELIALREDTGHMTLAHYRALHSKPEDVGFHKWYKYGRWRYGERQVNRFSETNYRFEEKKHFIEYESTIA